MTGPRLADARTTGNKKGEGELPGRASNGHGWPKRGPEKEAASNDGDRRLEVWPGKKG
jgi:hypothetical protein